MYKDCQNLVEGLLQLANEYELTALQEKCTYLLSDIMQDAYSFVVVGEFSTGKSTFINGLIGKSILPTGITPTTSTINVLQYGEPGVTIHYLDGQVEKEHHVDVLQQFIASKLEDVESINYIEVFQPVPFLQDRVRLIDTPGLNDVNALRSDITYQYIPRADVVFFLLDCRTPLRQTEFEFLTETLVAHGLERIIFVANFADEVDENELPFIISKIESNLREGLNVTEVVVIPYSAAEALDAINEQDEELLDISGYNEVQAHMKNLCTKGTRQQEKLQRFMQRAIMLQKEIENALMQKQQINNQSSDQLKLELAKIDSWRKGQQELLKELHVYYEERVFEFEKMATKSVTTFFKQLEEDIIEEIQLFQGSNFEHYFGQVLPSKMNKSMKNWIEKYSPQLQILVGKLETALTDILNDLLKEKVYLQQQTYAPTIQKSEGVSLEVNKQTDPFVTSGLIVGGTSALFLMLGGPLLLPIIGMVGLPYLQKKLLANQLEKIKPQVIGDLQMKLMTVRHDFEQEVLHYLQTSCKRVHDECIRLYELRLEQQYQLIQARIKELEKSAANDQLENKKIQQQLVSLKAINL